MEEQGDSRAPAPTAAKLAKPARPAHRKLRPRQRLGKYRLQRRLGTGAFAEVWQALDSIEDIKVALKIPHPSLVDKELLDTFRKEVRVVGKLQHENVLAVKNADMIDGLLVICHPLGSRTLESLRGTRVPTERMLNLAEQMLSALAYAHSQNVIHCDVKPENLILFDDDHLRICDFGIAKVSRRTHVSGSGSGTVGYLAPEQALGFPSYRSDVFSAGLVLYEFFTGSLPRWPFRWPPEGIAKLRRRMSPDIVEVLRKALQPDPRKRFRDAGPMLEVFRRARKASTSNSTRNNRAGSAERTDAAPRTDWRLVRFRQCRARFGKALALDEECAHCKGPLSEAMLHCPWCGREHGMKAGSRSMPSTCERCGRGRKLDWRYCAHCYGPGFEEVSVRRYTDRRYQGSCTTCRGSLLPFSRYCPWCRRKVRKPWAVQGSKSSCKHCGWGVLEEFWRHCPWCSKSLRRR